MPPLNIICIMNEGTVVEHVLNIDYHDITLEIHLDRRLLSEVIIDKIMLLISMNDPSGQCFIECQVDSFQTDIRYGILYFRYTSLIYVTSGGYKMRYILHSIYHVS